MPALRVFVLPVTMSVVIFLVRDGACWPKCVYSRVGGWLRQVRSGQDARCKSALFKWKCMLVPVRRLTLWKYLYTSYNSRYAVRHYVCRTRMCVVKRKNLKERKCGRQKLEHIPPNRIKAKEKARTCRQKRLDFAHESLPSENICSM